MANTVQLVLKSLLSGDGFKKLDQQLNSINKKAKRVTNNMNNALGGKRIENSTKSLATNLGAVGNRLGFMAFQWKFMAGAAQQALQTVLGVFQDILRVGGEIGDKMGRALAFGSSIKELGNQTDLARKELSAFQDEIVRIGSGKTIFNRGEIADIGLELQKAFDDVDVTKNALQFATLLKQIQPDIDNEKLATGLVTLFEATGINLKAPDAVTQMAKAVDLLANISDKSTLNFQSTIASFSKAAPLAKALGFQATELGTVLQVVGDVLGRNKSSGRAGSSAGTFTNAFLNDLGAIADADTKQGKAARDSTLFEGGFNIFEADGKTFLPLIREADETGDSIVSVLKKHFKDLPAAVRAAKLSKLGFGDNSKLVATALIFDKTNAELAEMRKELKELGTLEVRAAASVASTGAQMKRFEAAISGVKASIAAGLSPIIKELADIMQKFASDPEFNKLLASIGIIIGDEIRPALQKVTKLARTFFNVLKKNPKLLKILITAVLGLIAALAGLFILATVAFMVTVAGASMVTMGAQAGVAAAGIFAMSKAAFGLALRFIPILFLIGGLALLAGVMTGVFEDDLVPAFTALGVALTAVSAGLLIPVGNSNLLFTALGKVVTKIGAFSTVSAAASGVFAKFAEKISKPVPVSYSYPKDNIAAGQASKTGGSFLSGLTKSLGEGGSKISGTLLGGFRSLGAAGPIGAIIAVGATVMVLFIKAMEKEVEESAIFKTGLVDKWQQVGFRMTAATNVFLRQVGKAYVDFQVALGTGMIQFGEFVGEIFKSIGRAIWFAITHPTNIDQAWANLKQELEDAWGNFDIGTTVQAILDPTGLSGALQEMKKQLTVLKDAGFTRMDDIVTEAIAEILQAFEVADGAFGTAELTKILKEVFGPITQADLDQVGPSPSQQALDDKNSGADQDFLPPDDPSLAANAQEAIDAALDNVDATELNTEAVNNETLVEDIQGDVKTQNSEQVVKNTSVIKTANEVAKIIAKLTEDQKKNMIAGAENAKKYGLTLNDLQKALLGQTTSDIANTKTSDVNTAKIDDNSFNLVSSSKSIIENIDFLKREIIEIARNTNILSAHTTMVSIANVMWAHLIAEGNRAAGKLANLKVSKKGVWSTTDPGISAGDQQLIQDAANVAQQAANNQVVINLQDLKAELAKIQVTLQEANDIASAAQGAVAEAGEAAAGAESSSYQLGTLSDAELNQQLANFSDLFESVLGGVHPLVATNDKGVQQLDVNFDGKFDIDISNGAITEEQVDEITERFGKKIAEAVKEALGATV